MSLKHKKRANIKLENKDESKIDVKYFFLTSIHNYHSATKTHLFHVVLPFKVEANDKLRRRCNYLAADCSYLKGLFSVQRAFFITPQQWVASFLFCPFVLLFQASMDFVSLRLVELM